jgi:hypothetical protein
MSLPRPHTNSVVSRAPALAAETGTAGPSTFRRRRPTSI